jgi:hypothetical protein
VASPMHFTVRQVRERYGIVKDDVVLAWIHSGELRALNVSSGKGRPTWRIAAADLDAFEERRRAVPVSATTSPRRARRKPARDVIKFF